MSDGIIDVLLNPQGDDARVEAQARVKIIIRTVETIDDCDRDPMVKLNL